MVIKVPTSRAYAFSHLTQPFTRCYMLIHSTRQNLFLQSKFPYFLSASCYSNLLCWFLVGFFLSHLFLFFFVRIFFFWCEKPGCNDGDHELRHWEQISPICQVELQPQPVFNLSPANSVTLSKLFNLSDSKFPHL